MTSGCQQKSGANAPVSVLEVHGLSVSYSLCSGISIPALVDVSFDLHSGEILGVMGESGAGKSTLAAAILNLLPPGGVIRGGRILLGGKDILHTSPRELDTIRGREIAMIRPEPSMALHPTMRIRDQVEEILAAHAYGFRKARRERMRDLFSYLFGKDAARVASSYPHQLSVGQQQRSLIAMALACEPPVVIADEPTASLDPETRNEILCLFNSLRTVFNVAVILITHSPALLIGFADRVLVLYGGHLAEIGSAEAVLSTPLHPYTRALMRCPLPSVGPDRISHKAKLYTIPGESPRPGQDLPGCQFEPRCTERLEICRTRDSVPVLSGVDHFVSCFHYCD